ncbi:MAG: hypothetical protein HY785_04815 [Oscillatoriophycideae cyanobacterium NC_groundwater_1537_Pr4_S-0.65um_50_18]|nr:hypothetical protein [Oscillatoriophycideae cyanobacterium NC_groundwater_1537_Pr4_S-0.65um_50_18]
MDSREVEKTKYSIQVTYETLHDFIDRNSSPYGFWRQGIGRRRWFL